MNLLRKGRGVRREKEGRRGGEGGGGKTSGGFGKTTPSLTIRYYKLY